MELMLKTCEEFARVNNLMFSTDPVPSRSKTKCLFMCGKTSVRYPVPLQLNGVNLPWVTSATHLGHHLHQSCSMEYDTDVKRASFIESTLEIRGMFSFAQPEQIVRAVHTYAGHFYGSMLWNLYGNGANKVFRAYNTCIKLIWDVPRSTHNFFVENGLSASMPHVRQQTLCQYLNFFKKLLHSHSPE